MNDRQRVVKNILVTGGAGFIGSAFIRYLMTQTPFKGTCVNIDLLTYAGNLHNLTSLENDPRYLFLHGDICNEALIEHTCFEHQIDTIVHFAAESHVDRSIEGPGAFIETNIKGTFHLLEVAKKIPHIHFHHISTDEVYGCLGEEGYFTETTPYSPRSPYSASKAASDHLVRAYAATYGLSTTISNCSNNYGPFQFPEKLIPLMILNCLDKRALPVYGTGKNVRDWLHVDDHAAAIWMLLQMAKSGETYNIGGESEWRNIDLVKEIVKAIAEIKDWDRNQLEQLIHFVTDRPGHDYRYAIDCSKIKREIGWQPRIHFSDGLRQTICWYIEQSKWIQTALKSETPKLQT